MHASSTLCIPISFSPPLQRWADDEKMYAVQMLLVDKNNNVKAPYAVHFVLLECTDIVGVVVKIPEDNIAVGGNLLVLDNQLRHPDENFQILQRQKLNRLRL